MHIHAHTHKYTHTHTYTYTHIHTHSHTHTHTHTHNNTTTTTHNKPDLIVWRKTTKKCVVVDICVPLDQNVKTNEKVKEDRYVPLTVSLKRLYQEYEYSVIPVVLGATGLVTKSLMKNLCNIGFAEKTAKRIIPKLQLKTLVGSTRIVKSAMSLKQ